jgi:tight adherence protein C
MFASTVLSAVERGAFVVYTAYALVFVATFLVMRFLVQEQEAREAEENLGDTKNRKSSNSLVKVTRPFFTQYFVPMVRGKPQWDMRRLLYKRRIIAAGLRDEFTPDEFIAFKIFLIFFFPLICAVLTITGFLDFALWQLALIGIGGWFFPDLWVRSRMRMRQGQVKRALPFVVDLLALSTEAGLDFVGAIGKVIEKAKPSPLIEELEQVLKEIKVGSSRAEALREMAMRLDMPEMSSLVAILISADQMGAPIGRTLRQQSDQIRVQRFTAAEKAGAAAGQKLMFPVVLFILPAVFLLIFGPVAMGFLGTAE